MTHLRIVFVHSLEGKICRLNAAEMLVDIEKDKSGTHTQWLSESGVVDLFILPGPSPAQAPIFSLSELTACC